MIETLLAGHVIWLGIVAFLAGLLALVSAVMSTRRERRARALSPLHQVTVIVDDQTTEAFTLRSNAASPLALAERIKRVLADSF